MKPGDIVRVQVGIGIWRTGPVVGFNQKGEGGKDFVHILIDGKVDIFMSYSVEVVNETR